MRMRWRLPLAIDADIIRRKHQAAVIKCYAIDHRTQQRKAQRTNDTLAPYIVDVFDVGQLTWRSCQKTAGASREDVPAPGRLTPAPLDAAFTFVVTRRRKEAINRSDAVNIDPLGMLRLMSEARRLRPAVQLDDNVTIKAVGPEYGITSRCTAASY